MSWQKVNSASSLGTYINSYVNGDPAKPKVTNDPL